MNNIRDAIEKTIRIAASSANYNATDDVTLHVTRNATWVIIRNITRDSAENAIKQALKHVE